MQRPAIVALALGALLTAGCVSSGPTPAAIAEVSPGLAYAERVCASCHAVGASGRSRNRLAPTFRSVANRYTDVQLSRRLAELETGHYRMPALRVDEPDFIALLAYMKTLREAD